MVMARRRRRGNNQPAVRPFDVDGVRTVAIGTVMWAVAFVALAVFREELDELGMGWVLWTCLAGVGLGLLGLEYTRKRRDAIARARLREETDRTDDDLALVGPDQMELPEPEPAGADAEPAPIAAESDSTGAEPGFVHAGQEPAPVEPEPIQAEPEPIQVAATPVQAEFEHPPTRREPSLPEPESHIAQWTEPGLLDIGPPVPAPPSAGRRARRAASDTEQTEYDDDEPLLPMATDPRASSGRRARRGEPTDDFDLDDGDAFYRGRRARRP
jgi:Protein of unknown function (DUF2530)